MNHWSAWLAALPAALQRAIARSQRISLPRGHTPAQRHARLRAALCHAHTVREVYFTLDAPARAALQELRAAPRGLAPAELAARFGPLRAPAALLADPAPQSLSERLLLLGWLLPRPAAPNHPPRYLLPPELRAWLPTPLALADAGPAPAPPCPPALRLLHSTLLICAETPLALRADRAPRASALRAIRPRLAPLGEPDLAAMARLLAPIFADLELIGAHAGRAQPLPAARRLLRHPPAEQLARLRAAWVAAPRPDPWLLPLLATTATIDWPGLRRRLLAWAAALPAGRLLDPAATHPALSAALGPLVDWTTHPWRVAGRTPWSAARMAAVWDAALRGPLTWLGLVAWAGESCFVVASGEAVERQPPLPPGPLLPQGEKGESQLPGAEKAPLPLWERGWGEGQLQAGGHGDVGDVPQHAADESPRSRTRERGAGGEGEKPALMPISPPAWSYAGPGLFVAPHGVGGAELLDILPFIRFRAADAAGGTYAVEPERVARAQAQGRSISVLHATLGQMAGPPPEGWWPAAPPPPPLARLVAGAVLIADPPALERAARARSVQRYLTARLAPGVALVEPRRVPALSRALERAGLAVEPGAATLGPPAPLSAIECAALLEVCAFYRAHAAEPPPANMEQIEARLRAALPAGDRLRTAASAPEPAPGDTPPGAEAPRDADWVATIRRAIARRRTLIIHYQGAHDEIPLERHIRPLLIERQGTYWYLHGFCLQRQDERCFRLDRVSALRLGGGRPRRGDPEARRFAKQSED